MNNKITLAIASTSTLAAGITQAQIISSGPINLQQNWVSGDSAASRQPLDITGGSAPDFYFGFDNANASKPYVDARAGTALDGSLTAISGNVQLLAYANNGFPVTPGGTTIDSTYATTYPALTASSPDAQRGYFYKEANANVAGDWGNASIVDGYVGIIVNGSDYGYLHFQNNPGVTLTLEDWAYNSTPGAGITTPTPAPEPSTLALGGAGLAVLMALRRRK